MKHEPTLLDLSNIPRPGVFQSYKPAIALLLVAVVIIALIIRAL